MIQEIDENTFAHLTDLEAIDLSNNGIRSLPVDLLSLPKLRHLYLHENALDDFHRALAKVPKPIKAPLKLLNVAGTRLQKVPDFGILPDLWTLNISDNPLREITVQQFSPFCSLHKLDMNGTLMPTCMCKNIVQHLTKQREVEFQNGYFCDNGSGGELKLNFRKT